MKVMIVGADAAAQRLAASARDAEIDVRVIAEPSGAEPSMAEFAELLPELELSIAAERPDAVLVADGAEIALVAVLVATKLGVSVAATAEATRSSPHGRLIKQLADERLGVAPSGLADWARTYTAPR